jgi:hypothetical protein
MPIEEREGITERYLLSVDSLYTLRDQRKAKTKPEDKFREYSARRQNEGNTTELLREAMARLETRAAESAGLRTRLELTAKAESTLIEQLEREKQRADQERQERVQIQEEAQWLRDELEAERLKGFWRRLFSG